MLKHALIVIIATMIAGIFSEDSFADCSTPAFGAADSWLPVTPFPEYHKPPPHPESDCPFYQAAWQTFLYVTQPDGNGDPVFLTYPRIETTFGGLFASLGTDTSAAVLDLLPRTIQLPNNDVGALETLSTQIGSGIEQASLHGVLIDQSG